MREMQRKQAAEAAALAAGTGSWGCTWTPQNRTGMPLCERVSGSAGSSGYGMRHTGAAATGSTFELPPELAGEMIDPLTVRCGMGWALECMLETKFLFIAYLQAIRATRLGMQSSTIHHPRQSLTSVFKLRLEKGRGGRGVLRRLWRRDFRRAQPDRLLRAVRRRRAPGLLWHRGHPSG